MAQKIPLLYENVFSKSTEKSVAAALKPTDIGLDLLDEAGIISVVGKSLYVGAKISVDASMVWIDAGGGRNSSGMSGKVVNVWHKVGAYAKIGTITLGTWPAGSLNEGRLIYALTQAGTHTFYVEFPGDSEYAGCKKAVRAFAKCSVC